MKVEFVTIQVILLIYQLYMTYLHRLEVRDSIIKRSILKFFNK